MNSKKILQQCFSFSIYRICSYLLLQSRLNGQVLLFKLKMWQGSNMAILVKGKVVLVHAMKAYRENVRTAALVLNLRPMWK